MRHCLPRTRGQATSREFTSTLVCTSSPDCPMCGVQKAKASGSSERVKWLKEATRPQCPSMARHRGPRSTGVLLASMPSVQTEGGQWSLIGEPHLNCLSKGRGRPPEATLQSSVSVEPLNKHAKCQCGVMLRIYKLCCDANRKLTCPYIL